MPTRTRTHKPPAKAPVAETGANGHAEEPPVEGLASLADLEALVKRDERPVKAIRVPEWSGAPTVHIRGFTGEERDQHEIDVTSNSAHNYSALTVARGLCKPSGERLVPRDKLDAVAKQLGTLKAGGLIRLTREIKRLSGIHDSALEEMLEQLKADPSASSGTD